MTNRINNIEKTRFDLGLNAFIVSTYVLFCIVLIHYLNHTFFMWTR